MYYSFIAVFIPAVILYYYNSGGELKETFKSLSKEREGRRPLSSKTSIDRLPVPVFRFQSIPVVPVGPL